MSTTTTEAAPTHCERPECGQPLLIRTPGRTVCERCRLGRTPRSGDNSPVAAASTAAPVSAGPCLGCGMTVISEDNPTRLPLADGYCLSCRFDGRHLG